MHVARRIQLLAIFTILAAAPAARAQSWNLIWSEEFNGPTGTFPDTTRWTYDVGNNGGWGNGESEVYCAASSNAAPCSAGNPNVFKNQALALANTRAPYPGEAGQRNILRGDGYFSIDAGVSKIFRITERQNLKFAFESFNVTNSVRFDPNSISNNPFGSASSFGNYSALLTRPRVVQISLRYAF